MFKAPSLSRISNLSADEKCIDTISLVYADVYGLFTKRLMTLPAIETEESMSHTTISSDLLAASIQQEQATAHLQKALHFVHSQ